MRAILAKKKGVYVARVRQEDKIMDKKKVGNRAQVCFAQDIVIADKRCIWCATALWNCSLTRTMRSISFGRILRA